MHCSGFGVYIGKLKKLYKTKLNEINMIDDDRMFGKLSTQWRENWSIQIRNR